MKKFLDNIIQAVSFPNDPTIIFATIILCLAVLIGILGIMLSFFGIYGILVTPFVLALLRFVYAGMKGK